MSYYLITFKNTHTAISGEKILKEKGFQVVVMPTPTSITKSCGISIRINKEDFEKVSELIKENVLDTESIFLKDESQYKIINL